ncbi:MAG: glycosyltransferase [Ignavibacteriaceae bacterium]
MKIAAVVVTFNGLLHIKNSLEALKNQSHQLDEIIIVNNSSIDGTTEWLSDQKGIEHIIQKNSGSAGGQYTGIKNAYIKGYDYIWCLDQDIVPEQDALEKLLSTEEIKNENTGFLSSLILDKNLDIAYINVPYIRNFEEVLQALVMKSNIPIISASFGSLLIPKKAIEKIGLPVKEFFIWGDDVEYTMRMIQAGFKGFLVIESKAIHNGEDNNLDPFLVMDIRNKKTFFAIRNTFYVIRLRNKVVYKSLIRGILGCLSFYFIIIKNRFLYHGQNPYRYSILSLTALISSFFFVSNKKYYYDTKN